MESKRKYGKRRSYKFLVFSVISFLISLISIGIFLIICHPDIYLELFNKNNISDDYTVKYKSTNDTFSNEGSKYLTNIKASVGYKYSDEIILFYSDDNCNFYYTIDLNENNEIKRYRLGPIELTAGEIKGLNFHDVIHTASQDAKIDKVYIGQPFVYGISEYDLSNYETLETLSVLQYQISSEKITFASNTNCIVSVQLETTDDNNNSGNIIINNLQLFGYQPVAYKLSDLMPNFYGETEKIVSITPIKLECYRRKYE